MLKKFESLTNDEKLNWLKKYWPKNSPLKDIIINKYFKNVFNNDADNNEYNQQLELFSLFYFTQRSMPLRIKFYEKYKHNHQTLQDKINFCQKIFTKPSEYRDELLEEIISHGHIAYNEFRNIASLYSYNSLIYKKDKSIGEGICGPIISHLNGKQKLQFTLWLMDEIEKPDYLISFEKFEKTSLNELKILFKEKNIRHYMLETIFAGNKGLFLDENKTYLNHYLDVTMGKRFEIHDEDTESTRILKQLSMKIIKAIFSTNNHMKKIKLLNKLIDKCSENQNGNIFEYIKITMTSYGTVGIKLGQILASNTDIRKEYPTLCEQLASLKDTASPMSYSEAMLVISKYPKIRNKITLLERIGSASIKGVFRALIDNEVKVLKLRRINADKNLYQEEIDFKQIMSTLKRTASEYIDFSSLPNYTDRIFSAIREEVNFNIEGENAIKLQDVLNIDNNSKVEFRIPKIDYELSNGSLMVEEEAQGMKLRDYMISSSRISKRKINRILQKNLLHQLFNHGYYHADLHDGNIFIDDSNRKLHISYIDVGLCGTLNENELHFVKKLMKNTALRLNSKLSYLKLFQTILSEEVYRNNLNKLEKDIEYIKNLEGIAKPLAILNAIETIPNYEAPDNIIRLIIALSKTPYLYKFYFSNIKDYLSLLNPRTPKRRRR
ncbi:AarF/UbiB family protein [Candidatus Margulisiibacteriota bacterium]